LIELEFSFNVVEEEGMLTFCAKMPRLQVLVITGNPFALQGEDYYMNLERMLS
jgi:hypothetical protein